MSAAAYCAIDFGTSNSAIAVPDRGSGGGGGDDAAPSMRLVPLEGAATTMPTAVFYFADDAAGTAAVSQGPACAFGRAAIASYVDGIDGRLMRSMKSILGSSLVEQTTDVGNGRGVKYLDVIAGYLKHLKACAEADGGGGPAGQPIRRAVIGRPVFFVDDDSGRDAAAQASLQVAARQVGFDEVHFQYEPIAAAFAHERSVDHEEIVLVADIGGGTSDFSVVRVGPRRAVRLDRRDDILANHGVHVAGTDFDRRIELAAILREFGYGAFGPAGGGTAPRSVGATAGGTAGRTAKAGAARPMAAAIPSPSRPAREVPSAVYFDLATWHLINTVYNPQRVAELRRMRGFYADPSHHRRLMTVVEERLGHDLAARAEAAKIAVADGADARIDLGAVEPRLAVDLSERAAVQAIDADIARIVDAARFTATQAGLAPERIDSLFFTGGSTGLRLLAQRIAAAFPSARVVRGDRFASVATGLALHAQRLFGAAG